MNVNNFARLCTRFKFVSNNKYKSYYTKNILKLREREMLEGVFPDISTNEITELLKKSPQCVYAGFDPTADSLHLGNLLILMNLLHWQRGGHQTIAVIGGATGHIGDPSHRNTERPEIDTILLKENLEAVKKNIETLYDNHARYFWPHDKSKLKPPIIVNNADWYKDLSVIDFVKEIGKYFRLSRMLSRSSVQARLNSDVGMSFTEFTYQVFQGYDWYYLAKKYDCRFQLGGNDQMGNIMSGHELVTRILGKEVYGLTVPLLLTKAGLKFGKSAGNAVWLSRHKSSSFQLYQFFIRLPDLEVEKYFKLYTFLPLNEIKRIMEDHFKEPEKRKAQELLATNVTLLCHGEDGLAEAKQTSSALYNNSLEALARLTADELFQILEGATLVDILREPGLTVYGLAQKAKCFNTDHDAQRIILAGGFYINHQRIQNMNEMIVPGIHILSNNVTLVRVGKRRYFIVRWI